MSKFYADLIVYGLTAAWVLFLGVLVFGYTASALRGAGPTRRLGGWERLDHGMRAAALLVAVLLMVQVAGHRMMAGGL